MAVKDSPATLVKARDAQKFMAASTPEKVSAEMVKIIKRVNLRGLVLVVTTQPKPVILSMAPGDKEGGKLLQKWATRVVTGLPPLDQGAVLLAVRDDGWVDVATWGIDTARCAAAGRWGKAMFDHVYAAPFQTWFGFGKAGVPTKLTDEEMAGLSETSRAYVAANTHPDAVDPIG